MLLRSGHLGKQLRPVSFGGELSISDLFSTYSCPRKASVWWAATGHSYQGKGGLFPSKKVKRNTVSLGKLKLCRSCAEVQLHPTDDEFHNVDNPLRSRISVPPVQVPSTQMQKLSLSAMIHEGHLVANCRAELRKGVMGTTNYSNISVLPFFFSIHIPYPCFKSSATDCACWPSPTSDSKGCCDRVIRGKRLMEQAHRAWVW